MPITDDEVRKIAHLARLTIEESDIPVYTQNMQNILGLIEEMNSVDTDHIAPLAHPQAAFQRMREDIVTEGDQHALFQSIAPQTEACLYLVPKVIDEEA